METVHRVYTKGNLTLESKKVEYDNKATEKSIGVQKENRDIVTAHESWKFIEGNPTPVKEWSVFITGKSTTIEDFEDCICAYEMILKEIKGID